MVKNSKPIYYENKESIRAYMLNPQKIEAAFQHFMKDLNKWLQDGLIHVNLPLLKELDLLNKTPEEEKDIQSQFPFYFHVIETDEKVTLFNHQFIVWIVPKVVDDVPTTLTLIALMNNDEPQLEIAFSTEGVYNTPKYVLKVLRHFLSDVIDTEEEIASISPE